jgi:hypothetical protein
MDVTVQQELRVQSMDQGMQRVESTVRQVVPVAAAAWRRVGQQEIDTGASGPSGTQSQSEGADRLTVLGVLVRTFSVAQAAPQPGDSQAALLGDDAVHVRRPGRPRHPYRHRPLQGQAGT